MTRPMLVATALVFATAVEMGRQSGVPAWNSLWAEDGAIFLADALNRSFLDTVFEPINGYMLLVPRIAAEIVVLFPLTDAARITALIGSFVVAAVAVFVYDASSVALRHRAPRIVLACGVVLVPAGGFETTANLANLHWYLLFACFWALVSAGQTAGRLTARTLFAVAAPLSDPLAILLVPIAFLRFGARTRADLVPKLSFAAGLAAQAVVVMRAPPDSSDAITTTFNISDLAPIFGVRVAGSFLVGDRFLDLAWNTLGSAFTYGAVLLLALILVLAARRLDARRFQFALLGAAAGIAFFVVPLAIRGTAEIWPAVDVVHLGGSRYFVLPILFFLVVVTLGADACLDAELAGRRAAWITVGSLWLASVALLNYSIPNPRSSGPDWRTALHEAQKGCTAAKQARVSVPIAPGGPWSVVTPCGR